MNDGVQKFGGNHTDQKLDVVAEYLAAYVKVMKKQDFELSYVDAFAGSGASTSKGSASTQNDPKLFDTNAIISGSPVRALSIVPAFDEYLFIDTKKENVNSLNAMAKNHPGKCIEVKRGDANAELISFCERIKRNWKARAVVFLDPFGLSVEWKTISALAQTQKVDLWYLVPVHAMSRQIKDNGEFLKSAEKIDVLWGSTKWREKAVRTVDTSEDLFGDIDNRVEKIAKAKQFSEMFREHLEGVFEGGVAETYLPLGKGRLHEFSLMFACANPSKAAFTTAIRIANHILRTA